MSTKLLSAIIAGGFLVVLQGCQTVPYQGEARDVKRKPQVEGVIAVPMNPRNEDRQRAEEHMTSNCAPYKAKIVEEGEVVVGQEVHNSGSETDRKSTEKKVGKLWGMDLMSGDAGGKDTNSTSVTKAVKEWQISYVCEQKESKKR